MLNKICMLSIVSLLAHAGTDESFRSLRHPGAFAEFKESAADKILRRKKEAESKYRSLHPEIQNLVESYMGLEEEMPSAPEADMQSDSPPKFQRHVGMSPKKPVSSPAELEPAPEQIPAGAYFSTTSQGQTFLHDRTGKVIREVKQLK